MESSSSSSPYYATRTSSERMLDEFQGLHGPDLMLARAFKGFHLGQNFGPRYDMSPPLAKGAPPQATVRPQQTHFQFGDIVFDSRFDSGNLKLVQEGEEPGHFDLFSSPDGAPYPGEGGFTTWFYFSVIGVCPGETLHFTVRNMNNQMRLYTSGLKPVTRVLPSQPYWRRIPGEVTPFYEEQIFHMSFSHTFSCPRTEATFFAFCYPFSYSETLHLGQSLSTRFRSHPGIYFHRQVLGHSLEKRKVELWTLSSKYKMTSQREPSLPNLFPEQAQTRAFRFKKPTVFLTARVHPGETPASYMLKGFLDFILKEDNLQARTLLRHFVFKIIPLLNVDGVSRGFYRLDTQRLNLNRVYLQPTLEKHPTIYAAKAAIVQQHELGQLNTYIDLHAHASKKGVFVFGNALEGQQQVQNLLFARLLAINCCNFDLQQSSFSDKLMTAKDKDGNSREGTGRVAIHKQTGIPRCYTLQANYHSGKRLAYIPPKIDRVTGQIVPEDPVTDIGNQRLYPEGKPPIFTPEILQDVGRALCFALLDFVEDNPISRVPRSSFRCLEVSKASNPQALRAEIAINNNFNVMESKKVKQKALQTLKEEGKEKAVVLKPVKKKHSSQNTPRGPAARIETEASIGGLESVEQEQKQPKQRVISSKLLKRQFNKVPRRESQPKVIQLELQAALQYSPTNTLFKMGSPSRRYNSQPPTERQAPLLSRIQLGGEQTALPQSRRVLHRSAMLMDEIKSKAPVTPNMKRRSNPFKQAGASVVMRPPLHPGAQRYVMMPID